VSAVFRRGVEPGTPPEPPGVAAVMVIRLFGGDARAGRDVIGPRRVLGRAGSAA
jgi:hypothetical protein